MTSFGDQESHALQKYVSPKTPDQEQSPQSHNSQKRNSHIIDDGIFKDSMVTTSITGGSPRSQPQPNGITIQLAQSQQVECATSAEQKNLISLGRSASESGWHSRSSAPSVLGVARPCTIHVHRSRVCLSPRHCQELDVEFHITQDHPLEEISRKINNMV